MRLDIVVHAKFLISLSMLPVNTSCARHLAPLRSASTVIGMGISNRFQRGLTGAMYLLPIALIIHGIGFWGRGIIDKEAMIFVLNYLERRPFLATIFDPGVNDSGLYQARELSYLFDFIDARTFAALLDRHILLLVPQAGPQRFW